MNPDIMGQADAEIKSPKKEITNLSQRFTIADHEGAAGAKTQASSLARIVILPILP